MADAIGRVDRAAAPLAERLRLFRSPSIVEADIARLAAAVAPRVLPEELVTLLRQGGLTPWEYWWHGRFQELVRSPFADLDGTTGWLRLGSYQRDHFFMVLPDVPAATAPVLTWSSNALVVTPMFPSLRGYFAGFAAAVPLWEASPLATDEDGPVALSLWWEPVAGYGSEQPIEGLEPVLRSLIAHEDGTWPTQPTPLWDSPEMADSGMVDPYWLKLRITPRPRPRR